MMVGVLHNLPCNLVIGTDFPLKVGLREKEKEAKILGVTTRTQSKAKMRMEQKQEGT